MIHLPVAIPGVPYPAGRLVLGGPFGERDDAESFRILDRFAESGCNVVETAHSYANGSAEEQIGRWLKKRAHRHPMVLISKVCHPQGAEPCSTVAFHRELDLSLTRLGVETVDVVLLHRDPVTESAAKVLEVLESRRAAGSLLAYGICNIRGNRLAEFEQAAIALGLPLLPLISNYYGLARQACAPWPDCVQLDPEGHQWLQRHGRVLLCWSALAQGWFARRQMPPVFHDVYDTAGNRARRRRVEALAAQRGVFPLQVGLAYTLAAPFDVLASVGPQSTEELDQLIDALSLSLTDAECAFLRGQGDSA